MIHRLALVIGGTGAAGVLAVALALGGLGNQLANAPDEFVPTAANEALAGGQVSQPDASSLAPDLGGGAQNNTVRKVVDTVYVLPMPDAPAVNAGNKPRNNNHPAGDTSNNPPATDDGNNPSAGDENDDGSADQNDDGDAEDGDHADEDDSSNTGDHANEDGGHEPGDD